MSNIITSFELSTPIQDMGESKQFLDITKPTVAIFRDANKKANGDQVELAMIIAEKCSGLSPKGFSEITLTDAMNIVEIISPFLGLSTTKI
jgi:hypothetical protein